MSVADGDASESASAGGLERIRRVNRTEQVREQLLAAIRRGDFAPGEPLPSERALCDTFNVSRVSVREAIRGLEAMDVVEVRHGRGCYVTEATADGYSEAFTQWLAHHRNELRDLMEVRGALEGLTAESAAQRATEEDRTELARLREAFTEAAEGGSSVDVLVERDIALHEKVADATRNDLLARLVRELNAHLADSRSAVFEPRSNVVRSNAQHTEIVDAVIAGKPDEARQRAAAHVVSVSNDMLSFGL